MSVFPIYRLSDEGRKVTWRQWLRIGGCGLSHTSEWSVCRVLGPAAHWSEDITLGDIEDAWPAAGREIARFAATHLRKPELVVLL